MFSLWLGLAFTAIQCEMAEICQQQGIRINRSEWCGCFAIELAD
ncbi:hypothetical protein EVA_20415 [gut metagenome]|uniref:Uncharacterized protein n=1 Tax=gut metagenome TaxID=749906 RepID=J9FVS7_9ZZZZ